LKRWSTAVTLFPSGESSEHNEEEILLSLSSLLRLSSSSRKLEILGIGLLTFEVEGWRALKLLSESSGSFML
jgi:hypothetical protein